MLIIILLLSIIIDIVFGELPSKIHPVVIVGNFIVFFKNKLIEKRNRLSGLALTLLVTSISTVLLFIIFSIIKINIILFIVVYSLLLSSTFSIKLLLSSAINVEEKLSRDIDLARKEVSYLVSRNTKELSESFIVSATIESLTENITDSYVAPIFYFVIASLFLNQHLFILLLIPVIYRIINTLDAMVGYQTEELKYIGFIPAKLDDILNFPPSRLSGVFIVLSSYVLKYNYKNSFKILKRDARNCPSPNSGYTMAPTAGALDIELIKKNTYKLGDSNRTIVASDISKAVKLSKLTIILFTAVMILFMVIAWK